MGMRTYFFALGTNHTLSKIDIVNTLAMKGVDFEIIEASGEILLISTKTELDAKSLINELGSAAKIGEVYGIYDKENWPDNFLKDDLTRQNLQGNFSRVKEKFGVSVYGAGGKFKELNEVFYSSRKLKEKVKGMENMREIRESGRTLSTVAVDKNNLLNSGFELVLCVGSKGIYVGKTLAIQDYESYSRRDYGRPGRNAKSGMIPPKLAKMMINLAGKNKEDIFLDPFCGSGTFLQELVLLGYKNAIGSDAEGEATNNSRINIEWLFENYRNVKKEDCKIELFTLDARKLSSQISPKTVDAIVTEPYLGSADRKFFKPEQIKREVDQLENLYLSVFQEFKKVLKNDGVVVIIFPVFRYQNKLPRSKLTRYSDVTSEKFDSLSPSSVQQAGRYSASRNQFFHLQILDKIYSLGFKSGDFITEEIKGSDLLKLQITNRNSVVFFRPGQAVSREILVFKNAS